MFLYKGVDILCVVYWSVKKFGGKFFHQYTAEITLYLSPHL